MNYKEEILKLKKELDVVLVAHFYQRDEVFELADITGDSLELAKKLWKATKSLLYFVELDLWERVQNFKSTKKSSNT